MSDFSLNPLVLVGIGSSFAFSGVFYHLYQNKKQEVDELKKIPCFRPDQHLVKVLKASRHNRLHYAAVEGVVEADTEPLASRFVPRCFGVIQKITMQEHWKYWNSVSNSWGSKTTNKKETNNFVPFSLVSPGSYIPDVFVKVQNPLEVSGFFLETVYQKMKRAEEGLVEMVLEGLSGEKPVGLEEVEELLRVGSTVTGFGEVVLEGDQVIRLQPPKDGRKYFLTPTDHRGFISQHEGVASLWKTLSAVTGITGTAILAGLVYSFFEKKDDRSKKV
ncbi:mitochondrial ubiquitin ligase activator of nfkb 1-A [Oryzias melastigma]|uniref:mitochondrial ubiquitin ligase activator of nfkb 1-A n=1 Tax=Oryzias melastigma TaxID=30732 RepID=UPI000CF821DE|nr:mitochondrial ubiquitin ligase activator of nfkb 1-A [Oryzias melastigma]